jgi:hypothetical protein
MLLGRFVFLIALAVLSACSSAPVKREKSQLTYTPAQLRLMEVDEMSAMIGDYVRQFKKTRNDNFAKQALIVALSRPDSDNILDREMQMIENSFERGHEWENTLTSVVDTAANALKEKTCSVQDEVAYTIVLENVLLQARTQFNKTDVDTSYELATLNKIADMDLEVSDAAKHEAKLNSMNSLISPSDIAKKLLEEIQALPKSHK